MPNWYYLNRPRRPEASSVGGSGTQLLLDALVEARDIDDDALVRMRPSILTGSAVAPAGSAVACDAVAEPLGNRLPANSVPTAGGLGLEGSP